MIKLQLICNNVTVISDNKSCLDSQVPIKKTELKVDSFTVYCEIESHNKLHMKNCSLSPTYSIPKNQDICTTLT